MCEMRVIVQEEGQEVLLRENITRLEMVPNGVKVSSLFEGPVELPNMTIDYIDFTVGKVVLGKQ